MSSNKKPKRPGRLARFFSGTLVFFTGITMLITVCALVFVLVGFARFSYQVRSPHQAAEISSTDAVVVLTGGKDRIQTATGLLTRLNAKRLFISGVHADVSKAAVGKTAGIPRDLLSCCVDLDYKAMDTKGNAAETGKWVEKHGFTNLVLVTSDYHMPRSLLEMRQALPNISIKPHRVGNENIRASNWYRTPKTLKLLAYEYSKYLAASFRIDYQRIDDEITRFASANGF